MKRAATQRPWRRWFRRAGATAILLVLAFALARVIWFQGPCRPVEALPGGPLVDLHCHLAGLGAGDSGCFVSDALRRNWRFGFYLRSFGVTEREMLERGDALMAARLAEMLARSRHVQQAVVLAMDGVVDARGEPDRARTEFLVPNEFVAAVCRRHTNLLFGASINPYRADALERLDWARANGAVLLKWLPAIQHIDPGDERLAPFYRRMAELRLPLLTHTGKEDSFTRSADEYSDPDRLRLPLSLGVTVIAAHVAMPGTHDGERDVDRLARLMTQHTNLLADISSLTQINKLGTLAEVLRRPEFEGRLLYGSDFPLINMPMVSPWYFPLNLRLQEMWRISRLDNPWDRDVELKQALGLPAAVFTRGGAWLAPARTPTPRD